ncbi:MAG: universal stress protein [Panacagrimonas sp.]
MVTQAQTAPLIRACVDHSSYAGTIVDHAAWIARNSGWSLELLHVLDRHPEISHGKDHSGAIGIDAQDQLLQELSSDDEQRSRQMRDQGRVLLNQLRERACAPAAGRPPEQRLDNVDVRQRHGQLEETLIELQSETALYVLGRRGSSAGATQRDLGRNIEGIVRSIRKPILTVAEPFVEPQRLMLAFDASGSARRRLQRIAALPWLKGLSINIVLSGHAADKDASKALDSAARDLADAGYAQVNPVRIPGDPERSLSRYILDHDIGLLIMGAYSHSPLRRMLTGSITSDLLRAVRIPTLLIR